MSIYFFVYCLLLLFTMASHNRKSSFGIFYIVFLALFILAALRYDIGIDYSSYMIIFENPQKLHTNEKGFMIINSCLKNFGFSVQSLIIIWAGLTLIFAFSFIKENSSNPIFSIFIFFTYPLYLQSLNTIRQALAIYIFLYSIKFIKQKKFFHYFFSILATAFFTHNSALVLIPLYFFINKKFKIEFQIIVLLISLLSSQILSIFFSFIPQYAVYSKIALSGTSITPVYFVDILLCALSVLFLKNKLDIRIYNISFMALCIFLMGVTVMGTPPFVPIERISEYFLPVLTIFVPELIKKSKLKKILFLLSLGCFSGIFLLGIVIKGVRNENVPYKVFFNKFDTPFIYDSIFIILFILLSYFLLCKNKSIKNYFFNYSMEY